jgi:hypothetical protein
MIFSESQSASLWLDKPARNTKITAASTSTSGSRSTTSKTLTTSKIHAKLLKFRQRFEEVPVSSTKQSKLQISYPLSVSHVSHLDSSFSFDLESAFDNVPAHTLDEYIPQHRSHSRHTSLLVEDVQDQHQPMVTPLSSVVSNSYNNAAEQLVSLDPVQKANLKAISSYRTSPTPLWHSNSHITSPQSKRNSIASTTIAIGSQFSNTSTFTASTSIRSDLASASGMLNKLSLIMPQQNSNAYDDINENDIDSEDGGVISDLEDDRFSQIPSAPLPPKSIIEPVEMLTAIYQRQKELDDILIASDSEDDYDDEEELCQKIMKFTFTDTLQCVTENIAQQDDENDLVGNDIVIDDVKMQKMNARCRDSVIQLLEDEALEQQLLMDLLDNTQKSLHKSISIPKLSSFKSIPTLNDIQEEEEEEEEEEAHKLLEKEFEGFGEPSDGSIIDTTFNLASSVPSRGLSSSSSSSSSRVCDVDFFKDIEVNLDDTLSLQASDDVVGV